MQTSFKIILTAPPDQSRTALALGVPVAHMAYRVGGGPHLYRSNMPVAIRGGLMVIDDTGFDGLGESAPFCQEVMRECGARNFDGVVCDFEARPFSILGKIVAELGELTHRRGWPMYVAEPYARFSDKTRVLIPTALSGGSLRQRLQEASEQYGAARVALAIERVAQDFFLPSPNGQGSPLTQEELETRIERLSPSIFFSNELCAYYFTYMSPQNGAHFILFDNAASIRKKLQVARSLDITDALIPYPQVTDLLPEILS
ncbi:conserved hypothetical protein [uncultured Eubacteriales bacterium]|uniref:Uncharacterized protein n=1 Tax=uncultured Eubacteriales bacterium TaxID=172733 RepID=A0A212K4J0_9FIRM|nr:conserved hypothetical protein [uncultured Eubacteriales bacterium]